MSFDEEEVIKMLQDDEEEPEEIVEEPEGDEIQPAETEESDEERVAEGEQPEGAANEFALADALHEFLANKDVDPFELSDELIAFMIELIAFDYQVEGADIVKAVEEFKNMPKGGDPAEDQPKPEIEAAKLTLQKFIDAVGGDIDKGVQFFAEFMKTFAEPSVIVTEPGPSPDAENNNGKTFPFQKTEGMEEVLDKWTEFVFKSEN